MEQALTDRLIEAVGAKSVDGPRSLVRPASRNALVAAVRTLAEAHVPMAVTSSDAVMSADPNVALISLIKLDHIEVDSAIMVLQAEAGATVAAVREAARRQQLAVIGLPESVAADRVGALVVRGQVPRRSLCGVEAVLPTGEHVHHGGRVLKDVTGYDLSSLLLGSRGTLAIVMAASFRLEPVGAAVPAGAPHGEVTEPVLTGLSLAFDPEGLLHRRR